jgi:hypothetical protein
MNVHGSIRVIRVIRVAFGPPLILRALCNSA